MSQIERQIWTTSTDGVSQKKSDVKVPICIDRAVSTVRTPSVENHRPPSAINTNTFTIITSANPTRIKEHVCGLQQSNRKRSNPRMIDCVVVLSREYKLIVVARHSARRCGQLPRWRRIKSRVLLYSTTWDFGDAVDAQSVAWQSASRAR